MDNYIDNYRFMFTDFGSVPNLESIDRALTLLPIAWLAKVLGQSTPFIHRFLYFVIPLVGLGSAYFLGRHVLSRWEGTQTSTIALVAGSFLYAFSPWAAEQMQAYLFWLAYALSPALILFCLKFFERPSWQEASIIALLFSFLAATPHYLVYSILIAGLIGLLSMLLVRPRTHESRYLGRIVGWGLFGIVLFSLINAYWIYPTVMLLASDIQSIAPGYSVTRQMIEMFSTNSVPVNVLRGFDQWMIWYQFDARMGFVFNSLWVANSLAVPLAAWGTLLYGSVRRNRHIQILAILSVLFGVLALGTNLPFYDWLVFEIPLVSSFGWLLRVPGKLSYVPWIFYSSALSVLVSRVMKTKSLVWRTVGATALVGAIVVLISPKAFVYFTDYYAPVEMPPAYQELNDYLLQEESADARVAYMAPFNSSFGRNSLRFETSFTWALGHLAAATPVLSSPIPSIGYYHLTYRDWQRTLYESLEPTIPRHVGRDLLAPAGVKYLVYENDIVGGESEARADIAALRKSDLNFGRSFDELLTVWINPHHRGLFWTDHVGEVPSPLEVRKFDPTRYELELSRAGADGVLMGQPFNPLWRLETGADFVSPSKTSDGYMSFELPDDPGDRAIVEYVPQDHYETGLRLTAIGGVVAMVAYLGARGWRRKR